MIDCRYFDIRKSGFGLSELLKLIPWKEKREQIMKFRFEKDRLLHAHAWAMTAVLLKEAGVRDPVFRANAYGKPFLVDDCKIHFNLSHSGEIAVCALSDCPIGVDVEKPRKYHDKVARRCFTAKEILFLEQAESLDDAFVKMWTRKESYVKQKGTGMATPLDSFSVLPKENTACFYEADVFDHHICICSDHQEEITFQEFMWK